MLNELDEKRKSSLNLLSSQIKLLQFLLAEAAIRDIQTSRSLQTLTITHAKQFFETLLKQSENGSTLAGIEEAKRAAAMAINQSAAELMRGCLRAEHNYLEEFAQEVERIKGKLPRKRIMLHGFPTARSITFIYPDLQDYAGVVERIDPGADDFLEKLSTVCELYKSALSDLKKITTDIHSRYLWIEKYLDDKRRVNVAVAAFLLSLLSIILFPMITELFQYFTTGIQQFLFGGFEVIAHAITYLIGLAASA